ncbi:MAG: MATE family efflux transporter [Polyangiaceae bacterium]
MAPSPPAPREPTLFRLAAPIAASAIGDAAIGVVDVKLVAPIGAAAVAGVGISCMILFLINITVCGLLRGVKILASEDLARGHEGRARTVLRAGIVLAFALGVVVQLFATHATGGLFRLIGVDGSFLAPAHDYLATRAFGNGAAYAYVAILQLRHARGDGAIQVVGSVTGNVVNAALAFALVAGHFGAPALGVTGAGLAAMIAEWTVLAVVVLIVRRDVFGEGAPPDDVDAPSGWGSLRAIVKEGGPIAAQSAGETLAFTTFSSIMATLGPTQVAAHQITGAIVGGANVLGGSVGEAATVLVARAIAVKRLDEADRVTLRAVVGTACLLGACGLFFFLGADALAGSFTAEPELRGVIAKLVRIAACYQVFDAVQCVMRGALRGARDSRRAAAVGMAIVWGCVPGAAWLLGRRLGWGAAGGWIGYAAEATLSALCFTLLWRTGAWRRPAPARGDRVEVARAPAPLALACAPDGTEP